jgi:hypothetical protein
VSYLVHESGNGRDQKPVSERSRRRTAGGISASPVTRRSLSVTTGRSVHQTFRLELSKERPGFFLLEYDQETVILVPEGSWMVAFTYLVSMDQVTMDYHTYRRSFSNFCSTDKRT